MKKNTLYLIGAVVSGLLVLLAVPLGHSYIERYLSAYGGMDTQSYALLMQSAVTFILECSGALSCAGAFFIMYRRKSFIDC